MDLEGINLGVDCRTEIFLHKVDGIGGRGNENDLHDRVVVRLIEGPKEVKVSSAIDGEVKGLGLERDPSTGL